MLRLQLQLSDHRLAVPTHVSSVRRQLASCSGLFYNKPKGFACLRMETKPCQATLTNSSELGDKPRRSSDYQPTIWDPRFIESIRSPYDGTGDYNVRIEELKEEVKQLLKEITDEPLARLELIDSIRHLGLAYHFEDEIGAALARFYVEGIGSLDGLKETALCFRLLREHGHHVSSDVFEKFREKGGFMGCLRQDVKGLLSLYEATHLSLPGERILEEANEFCTKHLQYCLDKDVDSNLVEQVRHSLEAPLYWLIPRLEARHYIDVYEKEENKSECLLELAKLDFNLVQALHQREIKELSRWWEELGLVNRVDFSRDRIFENYLWGTGTAFEPQFSKCRKVVTKLISVVNVIDDFYDIYSTLEEAEQFTVAIRRWDLNAMEALPDYMRLCYFALYNVVNETAYDILKDSGFDVRCYLVRECIRLCEAYAKEARWFHRRITPSLEEYLENGVISVGGVFVLFYALYFVGHSLTQESVDHLEHAYLLTYLSSLLLRLIDDLTPSKAEMENGETSLAIQCHMKDSGESYEDSKKYIEDLINRYWKELNTEALNSNLPRNFIYVAINMTRACFTIFQEEDGLSFPVGIVKDRIRSLFIEPISM